MNKQQFAVILVSIAAMLNFAQPSFAVPVSDQELSRDMKAFEKLDVNASADTFAKLFSIVRLKPEQLFYEIHQNKHGDPNAQQALELKVLLTQEVKVKEMIHSDKTPKLTVDYVNVLNELLSEVHKDILRREKAIKDDQLKEEQARKAADASLSYSTGADSSPAPDKGSGGDTHVVPR